MSTKENSNVLPGRLIYIDYDSLPLKYPEKDFLYVEGTIPDDIWTEIWAKHRDFMRDPDWQVADLHDITMSVLRSHGLKVQEFQETEITFEGGMQPLSARRNRCNQCQHEIPKDDEAVTQDAHKKLQNLLRFLPENMLELWLRESAPARIVHIDAFNPGNPVIECPHCHKQSRRVSDGWGNEGTFPIPRTHALSRWEKFSYFSIVMCPLCNEISLLIEPAVCSFRSGTGEEQP